MNAWLTPADIPAENLRRVLLIPNSPEWIGVINGILLELSDPENWEQFGSVSIDDTVAKWAEIMDAFFVGEECP